MFWLFAHSLVPSENVKMCVPTPATEGSKVTPESPAEVVDQRPVLAEDVARSAIARNEIRRNQYAIVAAERTELVSFAQQG